MHRKRNSISIVFHLISLSIEISTIHSDKMNTIKTVIFMVLIMTLLVTFCNAGNTLKQLVSQKRGLCNIAYAACCLNGNDATCCRDRPCCPWANCASYVGR